jgi:hypothetical protein
MHEMMIKRWFLDFAFFSVLHFRFRSGCHEVAIPVHRSFWAFVAAAASRFLFLFAKVKG